MKPSLEATQKDEGFSLNNPSKKRHALQNPEKLVVYWYTLLKTNVSSWWNVLFGEKKADFFRGFRLSLLASPGGLHFVGWFLSRYFNVKHGPPAGGCQHENGGGDRKDSMKTCIPKYIPRSTHHQLITKIYLYKFFKLDHFPTHPTHVWYITYMKTIKINHPCR